MIDGLHEVILYVDDMARQVAFYRDTLGLEVTHPGDLDAPSESDWVTFDTGACTLALHAGGNAQKREGAPEIVFEVDDIERVRGELLSRGVEMGEIRGPAPGIRVAGGRDPEGNAFSIESVDREG